MAMKRIYLL